MNQIQFIRRSLHLPTLLMGLSTVMSGTAVATVRLYVKPLPLILSTVFVVMCQIASNGLQAYNYLKIHYSIAANEEIAGRMHRQDESSMYGILKELGSGAFLIAMTIGVVLAGYSGEWVLLAGAIVLILSYLNVQGPFPLISTPFAPLVTFLLFGPVGVIGVFLLQFSDVSFVILDWFDLGPTLFLGIATGLMAAIAQIAIEYPAYRDSKITHRDTFVTAVGRRTAWITVLVCSIGIWVMFYLTINILVFPHQLTIMVMPTINLAVNLRIVRMMRKYPRKISSYSMGNIALVNMFLLFATTMLLFATIGFTHESIKELVAP